MPRKSNKIRDNLRQALPEKSAAEIGRLVTEVWGSSGAVLAEYAHLDLLSRPDSGRLEVRVLAEIPAFVDPTHHRAVFVAAHHCNWELAAAAIARFGLRFVSLYAPPMNPWLDRMLKTSRQALGCELLPRDVSMRPLIRALGDGRSVAMVVDRRTDEGEPIPFFGADKLTSLLPARLALKFDCPLVPIRIERLDGARFRATFYPPIRAESAAGDEKAQAVAMMAQVNRLFEDWIRASPGEWFCSKRLWPKRRIADTSPAAAPPAGR